MLTDYQTLVTDLVRDDSSRITADQRDAAIRVAVHRYSVARPRLRVADIADASGMLVALPGDWDADFSRLDGIEYPVGQVPPTLLDDDTWALYRDVDGLKIMTTVSLPSGSTVRLSYTGRHTVSDVADTIPLDHREAVAKYAAALLCDQLAAFYANDSDSTIGADRAQGQTRSQAYAARARDYRKQFFDSIGVTDKTTAPASAVAALPSRDSAGRSRLFH